LGGREGRRGREGRGKGRSQLGEMERESERERAGWECVRERREEKRREERERLKTHRGWYANALMG